MSYEAIGTSGVTTNMGLFESTQVQDYSSMVTPKKEVPQRGRVKHALQ